MLLTKAQEKQALSDLAEQFDVQDVYFAKGKLFIINAYDIPAVEDYLDTTSDVFQYCYVEDDVYV